MKKLFIIAAAALVGMASCSKEGPVSTYDGEEGTGSIALFLNKDANTRPTANGNETESQVNSLEVWVFAADGATADANTPYVAIDDADFGDFVGTPAESEYATTHDGEYVTKLDVAAGTGKKVLVVANANPAIGAQAGKTLAELLLILDGRAFANTNTRSDNLGNNFAGFVMAGQNLGFNVVAAQTNTIAVDIYRNVAKITEPTAASNVDFDALTQAQVDEMFSSATGYTAGDVTAGDAMTFQLTGWAVVNGLPKSSAGFGYTADPYAFDPGYSLVNDAPSYTNEWDEWDAGDFDQLDWNAQLAADNGATETANGPRIESNSETLYDADATIARLDEWTGVYSGVDGANSILKLVAGTPKSVYLYESKPGILTLNNYTGYNADQVIAVIIEAEVASGSVETTRYWRINLREQEAYHIIRNSVYQISQISKITTPGHATPWEAEEEEPIIDFPGKTVSEFQINVMPWEVLIVGNEEI